MIDGKTRFRPVTGTDEQIQNTMKNPGYVYFASDTGKIYVDLDNEHRIAMGGSGVAVLYGNASGLEADEQGYYSLGFDVLEEEVLPKEGDLILNNLDGGFYRVIEVDTDEETMLCQRLSISGNGSGGGTGGTGGITKKIGITLKSLETSNLINGQICYLTYTANSGIEDGEVLDERLTVNWVISEVIGTSTIDYAQGVIDVDNGGTYDFEFGTKLRNNTKSRITLWATGMNSGESKKKYTEVMTADLRLEESANFSNLNFYRPSAVTLQCNAIGAMDKILEFYFDDVLVETRTLNSSSDNFQSYTVSEAMATHGNHLCRMELYQGIQSGSIINKGLHAGTIEFEIGVVEQGATDPVIWLGKYKEEYYNYDNIQIPYIVYDPSNTAEAVVNLKKNGVEIASSPRTIDTTTLKWNYFEITDAEIDMINRYSIGCGETVERSIIFTVVQDPTRKMEYVKQENLVLNFESKGRSNSESAVNRATWVNKDGTVKAEFTDFNWYNNGWILDENNQACLRISNEAQFTLPIGNMTFASNDSTQQSNTIEMQFKIRNIQDYSNLIKNTTRYKGDENFYAEFIKQNEYSNYDAFLQYWLPKYPVADGATRVEYDSLEFNYVQKDVSLAKAVCRFVSGDDSAPIGLCLGAADAFFSNGTNTVNVNYVEDDMLYVTMVYSHSSSMLYIYINGVITGVIKSTANGSWTVASDAMVFNSEYCDIDLYKIRIYNTDLNVNDVVTNHAVDKKDVLIYDQNKLAEENTAINEYQFKFENMIKYNEEHPNAPLMPYIVYSTENNENDVLPWSKKTKIPIKVEFVNTILDAAYASGELEALAIADGLCTINSSPEEKVEAVKKYYEHHCPSWTGDYCEMAVQGTSSEFYPRRNYKIKLKTKFHPSKNEYYHCLLNKGPFLQDYLNDQADIASGSIGYGEEGTRRKGWYMDNYTNPTDRWTMKVDYMESSGSYNAGFASLVGSAYSKHPLQDYIAAGAFTNSQDLVSTEIPGNTSIRWQDFRTSLLGFPVLAFHKKSDGSYLYVGMYRMLLDKGSDEVLGFKTPKSMTANFVGGKKVRDIAECWEFCNNSRGFCSYRDPWKRVELSFKAPNSAPSSEALTSGGAPIIADNIEYRYNAQDDFIDIVLDLNGADNDTSAEFEKETGIEILSDAGKEKARDWLLNKYKHWEKVNKWVWSTNTDNVISEGTYEPVDVAETIYEAGKYYTATQSQDEHGNTVITYHLEGSDAEFSNDTIYYIQSKDSENNTTYVAINLTDNPAYVYAPDKFYRKVEDGSFVPVVDEEYDSSIDFYELRTDEEYMAAHADLLVDKVPDDAAFDPGATYYHYDGSVVIKEVGRADSLAVSVAEGITAENFEENKPTLYLPAPKTWGDKVYRYDTKEYRAAKFLNELTDHFDPEYLATYFIMTEVFECYDSRGKNCMMASWGPLKEGGDYIWYPIFYDIDTQLGINNTGIPSFEYNVDATEAGNYSTSDSLLWNNFYKYFKTSYILKKYKHLRGVTENVQWTPLDKPTLKTIDGIEAWYNFDKSASGLSPLGGVKPLIATNLDMWWKYITITNNKGISSGITGWLNRNGTYEVDTNGTYFYALQGDRSQSRQQFLTSRIEYIDSWLNQGNYQRGGSNNIRGRVAANNPTNTSDLWINGDAPYYNEKGEKNQKFDAEYWINLKPIRSSYVTVSDDAEAYPSQKYDGVNPVKFEITAIKDGVMNSAGYPEQLLYIYGMNQMADLGEMHNMYWQEFDLTGDATHLTTLKLGTDELMEVNNATTINDATGQTVTIGDKTYYQWFNKKMNLPSIPSSKEDIYGGMPLLKEVNLCNITVSTGSPTLDLSSCEKLQNFRATGSNFTQFTFAEGVALDTLYLPASITRLELTEANLLRTLLTTYEYPTRNHLGQLVAKEGLWIADLFDKGQTNINVLNLRGGSLGYGSYTLLKKLYDIRKTSQIIMKVQLTNVNWSPYVQLLEGDVYVESDRDLYFVDNGHMGFEPYTYDEFKFETDVLNGILYKYDASLEDNATAITDVAMFADMANSSSIWKGIADNTSCPNITGIVYINNSEENTVDEYTFRTGLAKKFPNLTFFFKNVTKAYTAKFIIQEDDGTYIYATDLSGNKALETITADTWFANPYKNYKAEKDNWDFHGWSTTNDSTGLIGAAGKPEAENQAAWEAAASLFSTEKYDYTFYAVFTQHAWRISYMAGADESSLNEVYSEDVVHGQVLTEPSIVPSLNESSLSVDQRYRFLGWSQNNKNLIVENESAAKLTTIGAIVSAADMEFYAVFIKESVYASATDNKYLTFEPYTYNDYYDSSKNKKGYIVKPNAKYNLSGKVTFPTTYNNLPVVSIGNFSSSQITHVFWLGDDNLLEVGASAFNGSTVLQHFELPESVIAIRASAFNSCTGLEFFDLVNHTKLEVIENYAFSGACKASTSVELTIPYSVKYLGVMAFSYQNAMGNEGRVAPYSLVTIGSASSPSRLQEIGGANFQSAYVANQDLTVYGPLSGMDSNVVALIDQYIKPQFSGTINYL